MITILKNSEMFYNKKPNFISFTKTIITVLILLIGLPLFAQISYKEINSSNLNSVRKLKIKLPLLLSAGFIIQIFLPLNKV